MRKVKYKQFGKWAALGAIGLVAGCVQAPPPPPPPPPAPAPTPTPVPYRPIPPSGASYVMVIPAIGPDGQRQTVNSDLGRDETTWNFRSGWNVAALNCLQPHHQPIVDHYSAFLTSHARTLTAANRAIDKTYRDEHGSSRAAIRAREEHMTQVYNYFALPPARDRFCNAALAIANDAALAPPADAHAFAAANLPRLEAAFETFFREYEQYRVDAYAWDAKWGAQYGASQPGYVATYGVAGYNPPVTSVSARIGPSMDVFDPETGVNIPVIEGTSNEVAVPIVQPLPNNPLPEAGQSAP